MSTEQLTLLGILITVLVTVIGWIYTASVQNTILQETRKNQAFERELHAFRERLSTVRSITSIWSSQSQAYEEIALLTRSDSWDFDDYKRKLLHCHEEHKAILKIFVDPTYRSICNKLTRRSANKINKQFTSLMDALDELETISKKVSSTTRYPSREIIAISKKAQEISIKMIDTANIFANSFAELDKSFSVDTKSL